MLWLPISEINSSVSSLRKKISYRKHVHHNASRCWAKRKWLYVLWDKPFSEVWTNRVESMKKYRWKYESTSLTIKFTHLTVEPTPFYPWVCLLNTGAVRSLILRCLTGSHMTTSSKSNYRVRLNVNMKIADSISFYFNFGKGHYLVLRVKQHILDKARIFQMNRENPAIINWREKKVETCARRSPSFENSLGKTKYVR